PALILMALLGSLQGRKAFRRPEKPRLELGALAGLAALLFVCLVITFHPSGHTFTGHGENYYAWILRPLWQGEVSGQFPIVASHYDELLYNFFLYAGMNNPEQPVILYWFSNS